MKVAVTAEAITFRQLSNFYCSNVSDLSTHINKFQTNSKCQSCSKDYGYAANKCTNTPQNHHRCF